MYRTLASNLCILMLLCLAAPGSAATTSGIATIPAASPQYHNLLRGEIPGPEYAPGQSYGFALVGHYDGNFHDVALDGAGNAFLGDTQGLRVLDIADPTNPSELGFLQTNGAILDVEIMGTTAYLASYANRLYIVDISNPHNPQALGSLAMPDAVDDVAVQGGYAYVACWSGGLRVVDVSDPVHPKEVVSFSLPGNTGLAKGVAVAGNYAYVLYSDIDAHESGIWVFDIVSPANVQLVDDLGIPGADFQDLVINGDILYAAESSTGMRAIDINVPLAIRVMGTYPAGNSHAVTYEQGQVYLTVEDPGGAGLGGLAAYDANVPLVLVPDGFYSLPDSSHGIAAQGDLVYVPRDFSGLYILRYEQESPSAVFGQVLLPNQSPLAGITVQISETLTATSNADGVYRFDDLPPGEYTLLPQLPIGCPANLCVFAPPSRAANLPPSQGAQNFTLLPAPLSAVLQPGSSRTLVYTDTLGSPTVFEFPAGAVGSTNDVLITPTLATPGSGYVFSGHAFVLNVTANNNWDNPLDLLTPVTVTLQYSPDHVRLMANIDQLQLWWFGGSAWEDAATTCDPPAAPDHDRLNNTYALPVCKSGLYALLGPTWQAFLPLVRR